MFRAHACNAGSRSGRKWITVAAVVLMALILLPGAVSEISAAESEVSHNTGSEVVFLLDSSGSMKKQDEGRFALDAVRQAAYSLPSDYQVGFVSYGTEVQAVVPMNRGLGPLDAQLAAIQYTGYTNAGAGLSQAMELFSEEEGVERYIIMLSDGEIDMPDAGAESLSREMYTQAAGLAREKGIKICIIAVGSELNDPQMHIFDGAEMTDGAIYWQGQSGSLVQIMGRILTERMAVPLKSLGVTDSNGGTVHAELPAGVSRARLLLTSDGGIGVVSASYTAQSGHTVAGQCFAVIDMNRPNAGPVDVQFAAPGYSNVQAVLLTEYTADIRVSVEYQTAEELLADVTIKVADAGGSSINLLTDSKFEGTELPYQLNGISYIGKLEQGAVTAEIPADGLEQLEISVDLSALEGVYHIEQPVVVPMPEPPAVEEPVNYVPLLVVLGLLTAVIAGLLIWWLKKNQTTVIYVAQPPSSGEPAKKVETKVCTYSGKFNMYVVRTADGRDVPPQTYRLFGRTGSRLTLGRILTDCKVRFGKIGADEIVFYPGPNHSVIMMDQSERCTILKGAEILKKGMGYPVYYNEKITVTFDDETTEMEIHYKSLKPSEREI